jgi:peptide deformylase
MADTHTHSPETTSEDAPSRPSAEERAAWRANALRLVRQFPDPALRNAAAPIAEVDDDVRRLAGRMVDVMERAHGVGLAAPQLGIGRRILVYRTGEEDEAVVLINPELVERSEETEVGTEGCLSLLGGELQVPIERHRRIRVSAKDTTGETVERDVEGFEARVIQHEVDHLDGVLIVDRAQDEERRNALRELRLRAG